MKKILFLIHDLGPGGAEKVLVNLVNHLDPGQFDITLLALFGGGVNEQFLRPHIRFRRIFPRAFPGNSHVLKFFSPEFLHRCFVREEYDIEVSYLEGPCARIISGCRRAETRTLCWIHIAQHTRAQAARPFRSYREALDCYSKFQKILCVSQAVREDFLALLPVSVETQVLYNTNETCQILAMSQEQTPPDLFDAKQWKLVGVGKLIPVKGFDRLIRILSKLREGGYSAHLYILGDGPQRKSLESLAETLGVGSAVTFLGYQTNPYKYMANCDLFVCASHAEGFSTAATEALILGIPVCTVNVSGMEELLGRHNEWGILTENEEDALYQGIRQLLDDPDLLSHYREQAAFRGKTFRTESTVKAVEDMLLAL